MARCEWRPFRYEPDGLPEVAAIPWSAKPRQNILLGRAGFRNLIHDKQTGWDSAEAKLGLRVQDVDGDGTLELLVDNTPAGPHDASFAAACWVPARVTTDVFAWDGKQFSFSSIDVAPPTYRFEAAQDGDRLALQGRYEEARDRYHQVIDDESLDWWSNDKRITCWTQYGLNVYNRPVAEPPQPPGASHPSA
jgi:hypothetical protein